MQRLIVTVCLFIAANTTSHAQEKPFLVLDAAGHTDQVPKAMFTPDGKQLVSVSKDKTIRVWDLATGTTERTLRIPIGPGRIGSLFGAALSKDGKWLAVAGIGPSATESWIYLFDFRSGRIERVLKGISQGTMSLAFSPDGNWLVSGGDDGKVRLWDPATGVCQRVLEGHGNVIKTVAFAPDSRRFASASWEGTTRIWSVDSSSSVLTLRDPVEGIYYRMMSVAFSPDGKTIATGSYDQRVRFWNADGSLRRVLGPFGDSIWSIEFCPDSKDLLIGRGSDRRTEPCIVDVATGAERLVFREQVGFSWTSAYSRDGTLVATGGGTGGRLLVWNPCDGRIVQRLEPLSRMPNSAGWSADGSRIVWGTTGGRVNGNEQHPLEHSFHLSELTLEKLSGIGFRRAVTRQGDRYLEMAPSVPDGLRIKDAAGQIVQTLRPPMLGPFTCFSYLGAHRVVVGTAFSNLFLYDAQTGKVLRSFRGHTGNLWAVAPSPDDRYVLTASEDQTLRVWHPEREDPLVSLFFARDEWIAWTPQGYYAASAGGERLLGWHLNDGLEKTPSFHPAVHFRKSLYRPDVIKLLLQAGSVERALELAALARPAPSPILALGDVLPPQVRLTSPGKSQTVREAVLEVRARGSSVGTQAVTALQLLIDGRPLRGQGGLVRFEQPKLGDVEASWNIVLAPGKQRLTVKADTAVSSALSDEVEVTYAATDPKEEVKLPRLYVLSVGVSAYPGTLKLNYAAKDAQAIVRAFRDHSAPLFEKIEVKELVDDKASQREIRKGITWLAKQMTQRDLAVVFLAGHGDLSDNGAFYFMPADVDPEDVAATGVPGDEIKTTLASLPGRVVFLLDACHAAAVEGGTKKRAVRSLTDDLIRDLVTDERGVVALCASTGRQFALESNEHRQGLFTLAVVEALAGKAAKTADGAVYLHHLDAYVTDRVRQLSQGRQSPTTARPAAVRSFPLSRP